MPLNDAHCHFFSRRFFEMLARDAGGRFDADPAVSVPEALGWEAPGTTQQLANRWMAEIDRHQVQRAVLIASVPGDEQAIVEALAMHPAAFVGFFMVNPLAESAVERTRQALSDGVRGVCLFPAMQRYSLLDARVAAIVDVAAHTRSAAVFVHCGVLSVGARKKLELPADSRRASAIRSTCRRSQPTGRTCHSSSRTSAPASSTKRSWPPTCARTSISTRRARIAGSSTSPASRSRPCSGTPSR